MIGRVVYDAVVEYDADNFLFDPDYIGIHRNQRSCHHPDYLERRAELRFVRPRRRQS